VTTHTVSLAEGYTLRRATLLDVRALHCLEAVIFPRDAYPYFDLALMFLWPGIINLKIITPGGGLGGYLLDVCEKRLKRPVVLLTVREGNTPAVRLYQRAGYRTIERKWGYYRDGETGLVMEKRM
jgi:hypothetical protein